MNSSKQIQIYYLSETKRQSNYTMQQEATATICGSLFFASLIYIYLDFKFHLLTTFFEF